MTVLTATALVACGDDKGTSNTDAASTGQTAGATETGSTGNSNGTTGEPTTEATTTPTSTTEAATEPTTDPTMGGETAADGEACAANADCSSTGCLKWRDLEMGECVASPADGNTRIAGTLIDFSAGTPIASTELRVIGALSALNDPANAPAVIMGTSDAKGQVDITSATAITEGIGIVGIITGGDYYTTATGLASPVAGVYGPMNGNRDIWAVPAAKLTEWSGYLAVDADIMASLPLGEKGGVVGFLRDGEGKPKAGATIVSTKGDASTANIRYLSADGMSFTADMTSSTGIFIIVGPGLAEKFKAEGGTVEGTAGSAAKAVFVMILTEP